MYVMGQGPEKQKALEMIFPDASTLVPEPRFVPLSVMAIAAPAGTVVGERLLSVGAELCATATVPTTRRTAAWISGSRIARIVCMGVYQKSHSPIGIVAMVVVPSCVSISIFTLPVLTPLGIVRFN